MSADLKNGDSPAIANGLDCWLEAVRRRREQLEGDIAAGDRARAVLDVLLSTRRRMTGLAEDLYGTAWAALERASSDLAEFDRQSQGALDQSRQAVREVSRRLFRHARKDVPDTPGNPDSEVRQLEHELRDVQAADARLLDERTKARLPLEDRYNAAARDVLLAGQAMIMSLEADRPRLTAAVTAADAARTELGELARIESGSRGAKPTVNGYGPDRASLGVICFTNRPEVARWNYGAFSGITGPRADVHHDGVPGLPW